MRKLTISSNEAGQRFDKYLAKYLNEAPKSFIYKMLRKKNITLNGKKAEGNEILKLEDEVTLWLAEETITKFAKLSITRVSTELNILYEDSNILVLNKPVGMLSQKAKPEDISLVEYLISYLLDSKQLSMEDLKSFKPGISNRLDRNTSGIILAGKSLIGLQELAQLLKERDLDKFYYCIVRGSIKKEKLVEGYLYKDEKTNKVTVLEESCEGASPISTQYEPVLSNGEYTLLSVKLITGRTHQIRAHLQSIGHPIIGDTKYGDNKVNIELRKQFGLSHQLLHAYRVVFPKMVGELSNLSKREFIAPIPSKFEEIKKTLFE